MTAHIVEALAQKVRPEPWLTPEQKLEVLERRVRRLEISDRELSEIQAVGTCESKIQDRIVLLQGWIKSHQN